MNTPQAKLDRATADLNRARAELLAGAELGGPWEDQLLDLAATYRAALHAHDRAQAAYDATREA